MIVFKYKAEFLGPGKGSIRRPVADVSLQTTSRQWIEFHPYIDSGADITTIPLSLGKLLGFRLGNAAVEHIGGIRGSVPVVYVNRTMIKLGDDDFPIHLAWALIEDVPPLLGRTDVFDRYDVTFRQKEDVILFDRRGRQ